MCIIKRELWKQLVVAWIVFVIVDIPWLALTRKHWQKIAGGPGEPFPAAIFAYVAQIGRAHV